MAFLEWRKFSFFDLMSDIDKGSIKQALSNEVTAATSGYGYLILGDSNGYIHLVSKDYKVTSFRGYALHLSLAEQVWHSPYLVTIGDDEPGVNPSLKVWNLDKLDKNDHRACVSITRLIPNQKAVPATALCIHDNLNMLAVGFKDGSLLLFRGDITRHRNSKNKLLRDSGKSSVTNVAFKSVSKSSYLFVTTRDSVFIYNVTVKDKEQRVELDAPGCGPGCSVIAKSNYESHFFVGRENAVYCYTVDGRGPCYAVEGDKSLLQWFKTYLIIVSKEGKDKFPSRVSPSIAHSDQLDSDINNTITIIDVENKFIVFSATMSQIQSVLVEWGSFYIVTKDHKLHHLAEKDVQSKLSLLFKKNMYDVIIRIAKSQHYDEEGLVEIFRQYGDHLCTTGDKDGAVEQYIKTIGKLEPSYIIMKFMDSAHMEQLMRYLQALHRVGLATGDHTMLLLNCFTKLGRTNEMKQFLMTEDRELDFDLEIALQVVRGVSPEDALELARTQGKHLWVLRILLEDMKKYGEALEYIKHLDLSKAEECVLVFGDTLINHAPDDTTSLLKSLCTDFKQTPDSYKYPDMLNTHGSLKPSRAQPENFLHLFLNKSEYLVKFLEHLIQVETGWSTHIYNALVEHYLVIWSRTENGDKQVEQSLMKLLKNPSATHDRDQTLILCQMYNFAPGILYLYGENKMYHQIIQYHMKKENYKAVLDICNRFGNQDPFLWVQALWAVARQDKAPADLLSSILEVIEKRKLLPPLMVIEALGEGSGTLGQARRYLTAVLKAEEELIAKEEALIKKYSDETQITKDQLTSMQVTTMIFQGSRCGVCNNQLDLPSVHFLCQHSYHQHCFQSFAESDNECPVCQPNNNKILDLIKAQDQGHDLHETFHGQLEKAGDGITVVAEFISRSVLNTTPGVVSGNISTQRPGPPPTIYKTSVVEEKIHERPQPAKSSAYKSDRTLMDNIQPPSKPRTVLNQPEGLEANLSRLTPSPKLVRDVTEISATTMVAVCSNPFEDEYDESKNPFEDDAVTSTNPFHDSTNPFGDDDSFD